MTRAFELLDEMRCTRPEEVSEVDHLVRQFVHGEAE
jgi:hypothetical protein